MVVGRVEIQEFKGSFLDSHKQSTIWRIVVCGLWTVLFLILCQKNFNLRSFFYFGQYGGKQIDFMWQKNTIFILVKF